MSKLSLPAALKKADALVKSGDHVEARRLYQAVLSARPNHTKAKKALSKLGAVQSSSFANEPTEQIVRKIGEMFKAGDVSGAMTQTKRQLKVYPNSAHLWNFMGVFNNAIGETEAAIEAMRKVTSVNPNAAEAHLNLGNALHASQQFDEAAKSLKAAISLRPNYALPYFTLGNILNELSKFEEAIASYKNALRLKPDFVDAMIGLANALRRNENFDEAIEATERVLKIDPQNTQAGAGKAETYLNINDPESAEAALLPIIKSHPDSIFAKLMLGKVYVAQRNLDAAEACFRIVISRGGKVGEAFRQLSSVKKFREADDDLNAMEDYLESLGTRVNLIEREEMLFALAKVYRDLSEYERSFEFIRQGNAIMQERLGYDIRDDEETFEKLKKTAAKLVSYSVRGETDLMPIFIVGMPRSGTTLVEQIISSHSEVAAAGELSHIAMIGENLASGADEVSEAALENLRSRYLEKLAIRSEGKPFVTDKMPHNFRYIPMIAAAFPEAKIVRMKRDSRAVCWSNFWQYFSRVRLGYSFDLATTAKFYRMYEDLMRYWDEILPGRVLEFDYDQLTEDQEGQTRLLMDYLELDWEDGVMKPHENKRSAKTASNLQVTKPIYKASSAEWQNFEPYMDGVFDGLPE
ncbi:MAG: tetratricopeptide repeat protein [Boseongicola sp.]|nr:MAG: tetratricopeptide repeat protein [Boseongicola sp.]